MYKCNSKCNGIFALIRFSDTFYLVVPKNFFYSALIYALPDIYRIDLTLEKTRSYPVDSVNTA